MQYWRYDSLSWNIFDWYSLIYFWRWKLHKKRCVFYGSDFFLFPSKAWSPKAWITESLHKNEKKYLVNRELLSLWSCVHYDFDWVGSPKLSVVTISFVFPYSTNVRLSLTMQKLSIRNSLCSWFRRFAVKFYSYFLDLLTLEVDIEVCVDVHGDVELGEWRWRWRWILCCFADDRLTLIPVVMSYVSIRRTHNTRVSVQLHDLSITVANTQLCRIPFSRSCSRTLLWHLLFL